MRIIGTSTLALLVVLSVGSVAAARGGGHASHAVSTSRSTANHVVHGYTKKDGTVVQSYHATNPDHTRNDNYSTRGNVNPYTGTDGTKPRDGEGPH